MPRTVHDELDTFLPAITLVGGTKIDFMLTPENITVSYGEHYITYEFRETSHKTRIGSTLAFARALVGGILIGLRSSTLRTELDGDPNVVTYLRKSAWESEPDKFSRKTAFTFSILLIAP